MTDNTSNPSESETSAPVEVTLESPEATHAAGERLGRHATPGQVIALHGNLGAGKTTLTQGIADGLGIDDRVTSPTFTLVNDYTAGHRRLRLVHIDTYRLGDASPIALREAGTFGLEEILALAAEPAGKALGSVVVIEWAERVSALLPPDHLRVELAIPAHAPDTRVLTLQAHGPQSAALLAAWQADDD